MEQSSSWEADGHSASQQIPRLLWNPRAHYRVHESPPLVPILSQLHLLHTVSCFPSMSRSSEWSLSFRLSDQNLVCISHRVHACYMPSPSLSPWLDRPNSIWWSVQVTKFLITQSSPASFLTIAAVCFTH